MKELLKEKQRGKKEGRKGGREGGEGREGGGKRKGKGLTYFNRDIGSEGGVALVIDGKALGHVLEQGMQKVK